MQDQLISKCPLHLSLGIGYGCHDECDTDLCPSEIHDACERESKALDALISLSLNNKALENGSRTTG